MQPITATIRDGQIVPEEPLELPEGTKVRIEVCEQAMLSEAEWDNSPQGIAAWLQWYESLEPMSFAKDEKAAWENERQARKVWELEQFDGYVGRLKQP